MIARQTLSVCSAVLAHRVRLLFDKDIFSVFSCQ